MIEASKIQKFNRYTTPQLRLKANKKFRDMVRKRDQGKPCISCGSWNASDAGHYYSAGHYPELEMHPDNCHLQCRKCNTHLHGNLIEYRKGLIQRIGNTRVEELDRIVAQFKKTGYKHDRLNLIERLCKAIKYNYLIQ